MVLKQIMLVNTSFNIIIGLFSYLFKCYYIDMLKKIIL
jgi:hypothetical protein